MLPEFCGSSLLLALPDDLFAIISRSLSPRDICSLSLCCRSLCALVASEKVWLTQCDILGIVPHQDLIEWRKGVSSYRALCRFLVSVKPLIGIWVHQNPELGNVVYVMPGFVSVVGCRIIPQELGPLGIEDGPILWAPVFEIIGDLDGSILFFLHGREKGNDYVYPGSVKSVEQNCNVLLLEVEPRPQMIVNTLLHSKSFAYSSDKEISGKITRSNSGLSRSQRMLGRCDAKVPFSRLAFSDRRKLIEVVTSQVHQTVPDSVNEPLFPRLRSDEENFQKDIVLLFERRSLLLQNYKFGGSWFDWKEAPELPSDPTQLQLSEIKNSLDRSSGFHNSLNGDGQTKSIMKKTLSGYFRASLRQILGKSPSINGGRTLSKNSSSSSECKHAQLHEFLRSGDTIGLTLHASTVKLSSYRAWPNMHDSRFALYKLPMRVPRADQEYAGLWGGTFGWPPGKPTEDKPGKALFFLLISYEEYEGQRQLIATKILEGTHYVLHPNGSAMFMVNIDEPSQDPFPWDVDADSIPVSVKHAFAGEGIANGYGFRYPGSKPGSLFVIQNGLLAFIWKESRAVLTMQRLNLQELLKKGERVPALPPIANFSYLTKSYSNVFAGFSNASTSLSSPRQRQL
ncbi:F-box protein At5g39450 [Hevea brasiliensis]|uniref:F-box protein At5g39450 n=1 Tax=Hevea brasiliensis TaxID=3981 RepID=UPI0025F1227C|nr:F-box protein At5g39450 [Hevea brasiliensis]XP_058006446.1 F-box protein At5g39450 [Hevea brasiliensis]